MNMFSDSILKENKVALVHTFFGFIENKQWAQLEHILHDQFTLFISQFEDLSKEEFIEVCTLTSASFSDIRILADKMYEEDELIKGFCTLSGRQEKSLDLDFLKRVFVAFPGKQNICIHEKFEIWVEEKKILAFVIQKKDKIYISLT